MCFNANNNENNSDIYNRYPNQENNLYIVLF